MFQFQKWFLLFLAFFLPAKGFCENSRQLEVEPVRNGPLHEAFVTKESGNLIFEAVPLEPPKNIVESRPAQKDNLSVWIAGYWSWSKEHDEYIWISGVWRRPPPGLQWIKGYWQQLSEGWIWIKGFWSQKSEDQLNFLGQIPPDPIDEKIPSAPGLQFFWIPGYWAWDASSNQYKWFLGRWEKFDPNWVYIPAHYEWRNGHYVFVSCFWDWPLETRGTAYASIFIESNIRTKLAYVPSIALDPTEIVEYFYPWWPDYSSFYNHHFFYHTNLWNKWGVTPPWWKWNEWWGLTIYDKWALWWWWSHPGYPSPEWITSEIAAKIPPPSEFILVLMQNIPKPPIVAENGIITERALVKGIKKVMGRGEAPMLPTDPREILDIQTVAKPPTTQMLTNLRPSGSPNSEETLPKPFFGPPISEMRSPPQRVRPPPKPATPLTPAVQQQEVLQPTPPQKKLEPRQERPNFPTISKASYRVPTYKPPQEIPTLGSPTRLSPAAPRPNFSFNRPNDFYRTNGFNRNRAAGALTSPSDRYPFSTNNYVGPLTPTTYGRPYELSSPPRPPSPHHMVPSEGSTTPNIITPPRAPHRVGPPPREPLLPNTYSTFSPNPIQGIRPVENWPPVPLQLQNRGAFMNLPQPQRNPPGASENDDTGKYEKRIHALDDMGESHMEHPHRLRYNPKSSLHDQAGSHEKRLNRP